MAILDGLETSIELKWANPEKNVENNNGIRLNLRGIFDFLNLLETGFGFSSVTPFKTTTGCSVAAGAAPAPIVARRFPIFVGLVDFFASASDSDASGDERLTIAFIVSRRLLTGLAVVVPFTAFRSFFTNAFRVVSVTGKLPKPRDFNSSRNSLLLSASKRSIASKTKI